MNHDSSLRDPHLRQYVLWVRWLMIIATSYLLYFGAPKAVFRTAATLILIHITSNLVLAALPRRIFTAPAFYYSIIPVDAGFIALSIWLTQAAETDFYLIFILVIILAAIGRSLRYVFLGVSAMSIFYGWLVWTSHTGGHLLYRPGELLRLPFLVSVAIFIGYLTEALRKGDRRARRLIREKRLLRHLYQRLRESETKFRALAESTTAAIVVCQNNAFIYHNPVAESFLQHGHDELLKAASDLLPAIGGPAGPNASIGQDASPRQTSCRREISIGGGDGVQRWLEMTAAAIRINGKPAIIGTAYDVTERKHAEEQMKHAAFHDFVTGLPNRACFMDRLERIVGRGKWSGEYSYAVLYVDLDRFKWVNDSFGHEVGDRLLFEVGRRLERCVRPGEIVARLGGDEFGIILQGVEPASSAAIVAERIKQMLGQPFTFNGAEVSINASVGLAAGSSRWPDAAQLVAAADSAMYDAKREGGARCCEGDFDTPMRPLALLDDQRDLRARIARPPASGYDEYRTGQEQFS